MKMHKSITPDHIMEAAERSRTTLDNPGFCTECGLECDGVDPDAQEYKCPACGQCAVYGAEELLMHIAYGLWLDYLYDKS